MKARRKRCEGEARAMQKRSKSEAKAMRRQGKSDAKAMQKRGKGEARRRLGKMCQNVAKRRSGGSAGGLTRLKGGDLPDDQNRWFRSPSSIPFGVLAPLGRRFFEVRFFDGFFDRFFHRFGFQNGAKIDQKSTKSRCKTVCSHRVGFSNDFFIFLFLKLNALNLKIIEKLQVLILFQLLRSFRVRTRLGVHFCLTLAPFCLPNG